MLKAYLGDAKVWMTLAYELHQRNVQDTETAFRNLRGFPEMNEMNVAAVCAGYAFELLFKVMVMADFKEPRAKHEPSVAYRNLNATVQRQVDAIATKYGWQRTEDLLDYLDNTLCKPARKYWMRPVGGGPTHSRVVLEGRTSIDALSKVHHDLAELASVRIAGLSGEEIWPGLT